jgi:hypothetical protein
VAEHGGAGRAPFPVKPHITDEFPGDPRVMAGQAVKKSSLAG